MTKATAPSKALVWCCSGLEKELAELIQSKQIQARIDSHNKVLYARHADQRKATFQSALRTGTVRCPVALYLLDCNLTAVHSHRKILISELY